MTTNTFAHYDPEHGGILKYEMTLNDSPMDQVTPYIMCEGSVSNMRVNLQTLELEPMTAMPISGGDNIQVMANGSDEALITGIPEKTIVEFSDADSFHRYQIDDGELVLTFDMPQTVRLQFRHPAYITAWRVIHAY